MQGGGRDAPLLVFILAPTGNDAGLSAKFLDEAGMGVVVFPNVDALCAGMREGCGALLLAEEILTEKSISCLVEILGDQPTWSDIPVTIISSGGEATQMQLRRLRLFEPGGNVTLLERPFRPGTLVSTMEVALRSRRRQYEVRDLLQAVWSSGERLRSYYESSHDCIKELDLQGRVLSMNKNGLRMLGCRDFEVFRLKSWPSFWKGKQGKVAKDALADARAGRVGRFQGDSPTLGGEMKWWDVVLSPILDEAGKPERILAVSRDVTQDREQQEAVLSLKAKIEQQARIYDTTLSHINEAAYIFDRKMRFVYVNQRVLEILGRPLDGVIGRGFVELGYEPGLAAKLQREIRTVFETKGTVRDETPFRKPNGDVGYYEYILNPVTGADGEVDLVAGSTRDITERKQHEAELARMVFQKEADARLFDTILSSINDLAYTFDVEGNWTYANEPLLKLWGRKLEDIRGKSSLQLDYPPELAERLKQQVKQVVATKKPFRGETYFTDAAGVEDYHEYIFSPVFGPDGRVVAVCGTTRLTTARKRAEAIAESQRKVLQLMAEDMPLPAILAELMRMAELDCEERAFASVLLMEKDGRHLRHGAAPSLPADYVAAIDGGEIGPKAGSCGTAAYTRKPVYVEDIKTDILWTDFKELALAFGLRACWSVPIFSTSGEVLGTFAVYHPMARLPGEKDLRMAETVTRMASVAIEQARAGEASRRLVAIVESSDDAIISKDINGIIMTWNRGAERLFGYRPEEIIGKPVTMLIPANQFDEEPNILKRIRRGEKIEHYQTIRQRKDGSLMEVALTVSPIRDAAGKIMGASKIVRDITEQKQAERRLERAHQEVLAASHAKDEFLASLSHELRTPLNPVLLLASEAAENPEYSQEVREQFATIRSNVELEARLIDDLLDITRITHGKLSLSKEPLDVEAVLRAAIGTVEAEVADKKVMLVLELEALPATVEGDAVRLQQVFWNVLKNAVKFTPGGGKITVRSQKRDGVMEIRVLDTGIGMTGGELANVFEAFTQGEHVGAGGAHRFGGLGLGLAITRKLVELHGGEIQAESEGRNRGATFIITLPLTDAVVVVRPEPEKMLSERMSANNGGGHPLRVLLVEDHEPTRTALKLLLTRRHFEVITASNLADARSLADREDFQLLISDIGLPDGTGYELMAELSEKRRDLPGIALTGYGMEDDVVNSRLAGFKVHLTKPVRVQSLESALSAVLGKKV